MDLSISPQDSFSDSIFDPPNEFPASCYVSLDPPSNCSSPQALSSDKSSFFSFSSSNLTSLCVASDHSDNGAAHLQQPPLSGSYPDHCLATESKKEHFFTPSSSIDIPEHSDVSDSATLRRERYDSGAIEHVTLLGSRWSQNSVTCLVLGDEIIRKWKASSLRQWFYAGSGLPLSYNHWTIVCQSYNPICWGYFFSGVVRAMVHNMCI